ncbi:MAG: integrin alpha [Myxococcota bacterium]|nr:integrin alpha [Myxococcota bacterium]MDW8362194.1 integrin alpha [Myxococcales bacterium]
MRSSRRWTVGLACTGLLSGGAGCDPTLYGELADGAGILVLEAPENYPRAGLGTVVAAYDAQLADGTWQSRVVTSAGPDTPYRVHAIWRGDRVVDRDAHALLDGCSDPGDCDVGLGSALLGTAVYQPGMPSEGRLCVLAFAAASDGYHVRCEVSTDPSSFLPFSGPSMTRFGAAAAPLHGEAGLAVVGAPAAMDRSGALYRILATGANAPLAIPERVVPTAGELGASLATAPLPSGRTLVVAGAVRAQTVLVLSVGSGPPDVHACLRATSMGYGGSLAAGDVTGDGLPEVFVAAPATTPGRAETVEVYDGATMPGPLADGSECPGWGSAPRVLRCTEGLRGVSCAASGFGGAMAVGDVDADGTGDLAVGAPRAAVGGTERAGAVFLFRGSSAGLSENAADVLTHSLPSADAEVGASLAMVRTQLGAGLRARHEVVAGSPGANEVLVFLCTGLDGDDPDVGARCQPAARP